MRKILSIILFITVLFTLTACFGNNNNPEDEEEEGLGEYRPPEYQSDIDEGDSQPVVDLSDLSEEALVWREAVLASPLIAEAEYLGVRYEVHIYESIKYTYNTATGELLSGLTSGDERGTVLRDWIIPHGSSKLNPDDALFETTWANTGSRLRELIGYFENSVDSDGNKVFSLVTRARTAEYVEYIYSENIYKINAAEDDDSGNSNSFEEEGTEVNADISSADITTSTEAVDSTKIIEIQTTANDNAEVVDVIYHRIAATDEYILYSPLAFMYIFEISNY